MASGKSWIITATIFSLFNIIYVYSTVWPFIGKYSSHADGEGEKEILSSQLLSESIVKKGIRLISCAQNYHIQTKSFGSVLLPF